jgi:hypothetical protein
MAKAACDAAKRRSRQFGGPGHQATTKDLAQPN